MNQRGILNAGVAIDSVGNLWVTDTGNLRVLRFPNPNAPNPGLPSTTADLILGQTGVPATDDQDLSHFYYPGSIRVDPNGNVFVSDDPPPTGTRIEGGRVLIFKPVSIVNGVPQYNNGQIPDGVITFGLNRPTGLEFDPSGNLWVADSLNTQVIEYNIDFSTTPPTATPLKLLLRYQLYPGSGAAVDPTSADGPDFTNYTSPPSSTLCSQCPEYFHDNWGGIGVDSAGNVFVSFMDPMIDVLRYPAPIPGLNYSGGIYTVNLPNAGEAHAPDVDVFKPQQNPGAGGMSNHVSNYTVGALGLAIGSGSGITQLIAADGHRLMYWNLDYTNQPSLGLTNGKAADGFAATTPSTYLYFAGDWFGRICTDSASPQPHLWTLHANGGGVWVETYNLPLVSWQTGSAVINSSVPVLGGGSLTWSAQGIAVDPTGQYLWLADTMNNRVIRIRNPLTSPQVDIILGQPDAVSNAINQGGVESAYTLNLPGAVTMDHHGNIYVSDFSLESNGNARLLEYSAASVQNTTANCIFNVAASHVYAKNGNFGPVGCYPFSLQSLSPCGPWQPAFRSDDMVMTVGTMGYVGSRWPVGFYNPLTQFDVPSAYMNDFQSMGAYSEVFDSNGNLFMTDPDRSRVLIYWSPFPGTVPTPVPIPCTCFNPVQTYGNGAGTGNGQFNGASGPAAGNGYLYVSDFGNNRINQFNAATGAWVAAFTGTPYGLPNPLALGLSPDNSALYAACINGSSILKMNSTTGAVMASFGGDLWGGLALCVDNGGDVYVTDRATVRRYHENPVNTFTQVASFGTTGVTGSGTNQFDNPFGVLAQGNTVYVADDWNNRIVRWTTTDGVHYSYDATVYSSPGFRPTYMFYEPGSTRVHVADESGGWNVFDESTTPWTFLYKCYPLNSGSGIAINIDPSNLHVYACSGNQVGLFSLPPAYCLGIMPTPTATVSPTWTLTISPTPNINTKTPTPTPSITCTITVTPTPVIPLCLTLYKNSPNPFSNGTNIIYQLCDAAEINVKIYTISGEVVREITQQGEPGMNSIYWDRNNKSGRAVANGIYIYRIEAADGKDKKKAWGKMAVVK